MTASRLCSLVLLLCGLGSQAEAAPKRTRTSSASVERGESHTRAKWRVRGEASAQLGVFDGLGIHDVSAPVLGLGGQVKPSLRWGALRTALALRVDHAERVDVPYRSTSGELTLIAGFRVLPWLRAGLEGSVGGVLKLDWPDPFQPKGRDLLTTDRFSHLDRTFGGRVVASLGKEHRLVLRYHHTLFDGFDDPTFSPIDRPDHLAPSDHGSDELDLTYKLRTKRLSFHLGCNLWSKQYYFRFARDAGDGQTHAGPGGRAPNPLQAFQGMSPSAQLYFQLSRRFRADVEYRLGLTDDVFEGYYSSLVHDLSFSLSYRTRSKVALEAEIAYAAKTYGEGSYAQGPSHPELDFGDRRVDRRWKLQFSGSAPISRRWKVTFDVTGSLRETNFPDYVPGIFPFSRRYAIDWDYMNWSASLGTVGRFG